MNFRLSLAPKIGLWLALNVAFLAAIAVGVLFFSGGLSGWIERAVGDRLRTVADVLLAEMNQENAAGRARLLEGYSADYGLTFLVFNNDGTQVAGPPTVLPAEVAELLQPPREGPPPRRENGIPRPRREEMEGGAGGAPDGPPPELRPQGRPPAGRAAQPGRRRDGRIVSRAGEPAVWWMGVRGPVSVRGGGPVHPGTLFAVSESLLSFGALLDLRPMLLAVGAAMAVSVLFWLPLVVGITRDLRALAAATGRIAEGRFDTRVPAKRGDEIGRLGDSVNVMAGRLQALVDGQKKFLADVAHELGSPLGRLQLGTQILAERVPAELRDRVEDVREEVEQMSVLVGELLEFTKADLAGETVAMEAVRLVEVVELAVAREGRSERIKIVIDPGIEVVANGRLLGRAVGNVVRNALRHGGEQVNITIESRRTKDGRVALTVVDDGPGVPAEALARLGEPFFRPDAARQRETGGTGLGLSIVRTAVEAMGGDVRFRNRTPRGFEVELRLQTGAD